MATEYFIQFIWKHRLFFRKPLKTSCGLDLEIIDQGEQNIHSGPDFFNARIKMGQILWAGNIEVHRRASDWYRHGHHLNPAYNNVILHVVGEYDTDVTNSLGRRIQTLVPEFHPNLVRRYDVLKKSECWLPCIGYIGEIPKQKINRWLGSLYAERVVQKCHHIEQILGSKVRNRDDSLYVALASGYGLPVNILPFELLAKGVPFQGLQNHFDSLTDLEAILFGHSGMLATARQKGPYPASLWNRYLELKGQFHEKPVPGHLWRFLRLRPASFPTLRISQFASLIHNRLPLTECLLGTTSMTELEQLFRTGASEYWNTHYLFGSSSPALPKFPGEQFIATLIVNVIVPFLLAIEKNEKRSSMGVRAREILLQLKAESNKIIKNWSNLGVRPESAMESQALLQLYNVYCKQKNCLECEIGTELIRAAINEKN
jgi:hypothetical protein